MNRCSILPVLVVALLSGCHESRECERARLDLAKTFHGLVEAANRRQLAGADIENWKWVQDKVALLESSFMTTQVTWDSASKARAELNTRLPSVQTDTEANMNGFKLSLAAAFKELDGYQQKCQ